MFIASLPNANSSAAWFRPARNDLRLGLESGVYVSSSDQIGKTSIFLNPGRNGDQIGLYRGTTLGWAIYRVASPISLALGTLVANTNYDVYAYDAGGTVTLDTPAPWLNSGQAITGASNATPIVVSFGTPFTAISGDIVYISGVQGNTAANGTWVVSAASSSTVTLTGSVGSGTYTAATGYLQCRVGGAVPVLQDGVYCRTGALTRRYLGTFRTTSTTTTEDSGGIAGTTNVGGKRFLWNTDNQVERSLSVLDTTGSWSYLTDTIRQARATAANKVEYIVGLPGGSDIQARLTAMVSVFSNATKGAKVGIGIDSTTVFVPGGKSQQAFNPGANGIFFPIGAEYRGNPGPGYHSVNWLEKGGDTNSTFIGFNGDGQSGLDVTVWG